MQASWFGWIFAILEGVGKDAEGGGLAAGGMLRDGVQGSVTAVTLGCDTERAGRLLPKSFWPGVPSESGVTERSLQSKAHLSKRFPPQGFWGLGSRIV